MTRKTASVSKYRTGESETETKADRGNNEQKKMLRQAVNTYSSDSASFSTFPTCYVNFISDGFQTLRRGRVSRAAWRKRSEGRATGSTALMKLLT